MRRFTTSLAVALFAGAVAVQAQQVQTKTTVKADESKTVTYTGCVSHGTQQTSYVLDHIMPVAQTTRTVTGTSGEAGTVTTTTYALVPGDKITLTEHVGHKVQVTGVMLSGDIKTKTETKVERDNAPDTKMTEKSKVDDAAPQFQVTSIKHLADSCTP